MKIRILVAVATVMTAMFFPQTIYAEENKPERGIHRAYISGYEDGTIRPEKYLTREEAAAVIYNLAEITSEKRDIIFKDVGWDRWSSEAINTLASEGIVSGENGFFRPDDNITRAEMAALISRYTNLKEGNAIFKDIEGHWAEKYIKAAVSDGWMAGYTDGEFKPNNYITRAEAAFFINNALDRKPGNKEDMLTDMKTWDDNADVEKWYYSALQEASNTHEYVIKETGTEVWNLIID